MDHFQPAIDPRKQELLEARFLGARVSVIHFRDKDEYNILRENKKKCCKDFIDALFPPSSYYILDV